MKHPVLVLRGGLRVRGAWGPFLRGAPPLVHSTLTLLTRTVCIYDLRTEVANELSLRQKTFTKYVVQPAAGEIFSNKWIN